MSICGTSAAAAARDPVAVKFPRSNDSESGRWCMRVRGGNASSSSSSAPPWSVPLEFPEDVSSVFRIELNRDSAGGGGGTIAWARRGEVSFEEVCWSELIDEAGASVSPVDSSVERDEKGEMADVRRRESRRLLGGEAGPKARGLGPARAAPCSSTGEKSASSEVVNPRKGSPLLPEVVAPSVPFSSRAEGTE